LLAKVFLSILCRNSWAATLTLPIRPAFPEATSLFISKTSFPVASFIICTPWALLAAALWYPNFSSLLASSWVSLAVEKSLNSIIGLPSESLGPASIIICLTLLDVEYSFCSATTSCNSCWTVSNSAFSAWVKSLSLVFFILRINWLRLTIKSSCLVLTSWLALGSIFKLEFLVSAKFAESSLCCSSVNSLFFSLLSRFVWASSKYFFDSKENLPYSELGANLIATSLDMFLISTADCVATLVAKGIIIPTTPPALPDSKEAPQSIYSVALLPDCNPVLICPKTSWANSVANSVPPASALRKVPLNKASPLSFQDPL